MAKQMFLVKVKFFSSNGVYTYYSFHDFCIGDEVVVDAPNGERKVVIVDNTEPTTGAKIHKLPYTVKPIVGIVIGVSQVKGNREEDSPV